MRKITDLEDRIKEAAQRYYSGESIMSDEEFDELVEELKVLDPDNELINKIGFGFIPESDNKVKHNTNIVSEFDCPIVVGSLPKVREWSWKSSSMGDYTVTPKFDGISIVLYYKDGLLVDAVTRGNGSEGISIVDYVRRIDGLGRILSNATLIIRGELIITNSNWSRLSSSSSYKNQRNAISGIVNSQDKSLLSFITLAPYKIIYGGSGNYEIDLDTIKSLYNSYTVVNTKFYSTGNLDENLFKHTYDTYNMIFPCDGLVITDNNIDNKDKVSDYNDLAYKFSSESKWTTVKEILWNKSRLGKYKPVLSIDPVELSGATISRVTAFNAQYIKDYNIGVGSRILVTRSNEVIPYILDVESSRNSPDLIIKCHNCGNDLIWDGVDLVCNNSECSNIDDLLSWITNNSPVKGLGTNIIMKYLEYYNINSIDDIYDIDWNSEIKKYSKDTSHHYKFLTSMYNLLNNEKSIPLALCSLNIPKLGYTNAAKFESMEGLVTLSKLIDGDTSHLSSIVTPSIEESIKKNINKFRYLKYLKLSYKETNNREPKDKIKICITGKLNGFTKKEFMSKYEDLFIEESIANCDYLVKDNSSNSSKTKYAISNGIEIITSEEIVKRYSI